MIFIILVSVILFFIRGILENKRAKKRLIAQWRENYGKPPAKNWRAECYENLDQYHNKHKNDGKYGVYFVDDITWNDLELDRVFVRMDYTMSRAGMEFLYHTLRKPKFEPKELAQWEEKIVYFMEHEEERIALQLLLKRLGRMEKYSLYQYLDQLEVLGKRSNAKHYIGLAAYVAAALLFRVNVSVGLVTMMLTAGINIGLYLKEKSRIEPYITSFAYVLNLLYVSADIKTVKASVITEEREALLKDRAKLKHFYRGAGIVTSKNANAGNPAELLFDYVRMLFHPDLIQFNKMYQELMRYRAEVDHMFGIWGLLDTVISIGAFRASLPTYCVPEFSESVIWDMEDGYHPLLQKPVRNSLKTQKGVLITGSNASGKSTFLKTAAINALLSQTIHTAVASRFVMRRSRIYSSMALRDNMEAQESYYIVEIKAIKRILDAIRQTELPPVLCFVDEVLRGTNTVERIAASTQVLLGMVKETVQCFAATHDIELTELLKDAYENYHFEEEIRNEDVLFSYQLKEGKATTRNAIRLLAMMGYEEDIVRQAERQAEYFVQTGQWKGDIE